MAGSLLYGPYGPRFTPSVIGRPTYQLIQRLSVTAIIATAVPAATVATQFSLGMNLLGGQPVQATQALRIVSALGRVRDPAQSGHLTALGVSMEVDAGAPGVVGLRMWPAKSANVLLGATGVVVHIGDDDYLKASDYIENIPSSDAGIYSLNLNADISNSDAVNPHNVGLYMMALVELYNVVSR